MKKTDKPVIQVANPSDVTVLASVGAKTPKTAHRAPEAKAVEKDSHKPATKKRGRKKSVKPDLFEKADEIRVRRIHRRDLNRVWDFLKLVFRDVNRDTVEYQRPRTKGRFLEVYEESGVEQLVFEAITPKAAVIVGYAECAFQVTGTDNWINERYFRKHKMKPLYVEELAVHPEAQGKGVGTFMLEQLEHLARVRACTHLVLEVAENNDRALRFYRTRSFQRLDAAIFLAKRVQTDEELLPPRKLKQRGAPILSTPMLGAPMLSAAASEPAVANVGRKPARKGVRAERS